METKPKNDNLLALKVMRLTRPTLANPTIVTCDPTDLPQNTLNNELKNDCTALKGLETLSIGEFMILPQSFGNLYLGEIFSCYLCVHNGSDQLVKDVSVKIDLKTSRQMIQLSGHNAEPIELAPNCTIDKIINYEIKEIDTHILICEISYTPVNTVAPRSFRKFFKFQVVKPLDVKTKFCHTESNETYLEVQIQNLTAGPICLEKLSLETSELFEDVPLLKDEDKSVYGNVNVLEANHIRQYIYYITLKKGLTEDHKTLSNATNFGKLDIVWRSNLGERGRLQTSKLERVSNYSDYLRVSLKDIPDEIHLEEPVRLTCHLTNVSKRNMDLLLGLQSSSAIAWCGTSDVTIGTLKSGESTSISLRLIPLVTGLIHVSGLQLTDTFLKRVYDNDQIAQIFVT